ncbi:hypothetical protein ACFQZS_17820 [Mucilaginibacter calamicampi]|uniref:Uncharacterized protein n=1 Tax=Mucilaginibacter calamicampi TaxID=1302352 RepID=A0ABW2YZU6_9SPHI
MSNQYSIFQERALSDKEIKSLKLDLAYTTKRIAFQKKFLSGYIAIALIIGTYSYFKFATVQEHYLLFGCALVYILIGGWVFVEQYGRLTRKVKSFNFVLQDGRVNFLQINTDSYIELPENEDEGVHYFFQLSDNRILAFGGQSFYPTSKFPSNNFEITFCYGLKNEVVLQKIYSYGERLKPIKRIKGKKKFALMASDNYPAEFTIISGQLKNVEDLIRKN